MLQGELSNFRDRELQMCMVGGVDMQADLRDCCSHVTKSCSLFHATHEVISCETIIYLVSI